jgi:ABC-type lipoprotein export system ATPase subunit
METSKGSEWSKWDLHVHTPSSLHNNYGGDTTENWDKFIKDLESLPEEFKVIGINDYLFLDGYKKVLDYKAQGRLINIKLILPVIELRIKHFGNVSKEDPISRINMHVIFSDKLSPEVIESQFISAIKSAYHLEPGASATWSGVLTRESLIDFGNKIIDTSPSNTNSDGPLKVGFNNLNFEEDKIFTTLQSPYFFNKYLSAVGKTEWDALRWDGSAAEKKHIINKVNFVFTAAPSIQQYTKSRNKLKEQKVNELLFDCSDAHNYSSSQDKDRIGNCFTWVKSELTFEGLKQIINEPLRLCVAEIPPVIKRLKDFPTKFIKSIKINKVSSSNLSSEWFNNFQVDINPELTAIIGNKGKGKSALSDIIGLAGNGHVSENDFSFLNKNKFRKPNPNIAKEFVAIIEWESGAIDSKNLDSNPDIDVLEKVKYIPQSFLEKLCTSVDKKVFEDELEKVIFSRLENHEKLGKNNLKDVIREKKISIELAASKYKSELSITNNLIVDLESKNSPSYRKSINDSFQSKQQELVIHDQNKPKVITSPDENPEQQKKNTEAISKINSLREVIKQQQEKIESTNKNINNTNIEINELNQFKLAIDGISTQMANFKLENTDIAKKYSLDISNILTYSTNLKSLDDLIKSKKIHLESQIAIIKIENDLNPYIIIKEKEQQIILLNSELEGSAKEYQEYITKLNEWNQQRNNITGSLEIQGSLNYLQVQKNYLETQVGQDLNIAYDKREATFMKLLQTKNDIANIYRELYAPVSEFIIANNSALKDYQVDIDVALELNGFDIKFFDFISNGASGSFHGTIEGRQMLSKINDVANFNDINEFKIWTKEILAHLNFDQRQEQFKDFPKLLSSQLKGSYKEKDFYDFLFSVDYYEPVFQLKLGNKNLSQLSPGERGALLLIFYLLLDKNDIPIIIDQPEENLDNQSVYNILVHFIKKAKERRQIIIVTHNPNLAVVCDAEQIIKMEIAKDDGNKISMITGGIENPDINKAIIDILEGTRPAFDNRTAKYEIGNPKLN